VPPAASLSSGTLFGVVQAGQTMILEAFINPLPHFAHDPQTTHETRLRSATRAAFLTRRTSASRLMKPV
jgi:hypothetical protein